MRIARLEYRRFGPFTDRALDFGTADTGLHIVYGPNEAGKTTALRGLVQLLFGIPHNSRDNFIHPFKELRIGATLQSGTGATLEVIRRKGNAKTLRASDDVTVIDDAELSTILGNIDEATFRRQFGIDYQELATGSQEILSGKGDLGEVLFAAASGMADVHQIRARLESQLQDLFKPSGSKPQINQRLRELKELRKTIKQKILPSEQWRQTDEALRAAMQRQAELEQDLRKLRREHDHRRRLKDAIPVIPRRAQCLARLEALADVPLLDDAFGDRVRTVDDQRNKIAERLKQTRQRTQQLSQHLAQLQEPAAILKSEIQVEEIKQSFGSYRKAADDRKKLEGQLAEVERQIEAQLRALQHADADSGTDWNISVIERQRIMDLGTKRGGLQNTVDLHRQALAKLQKDIDAAERQLERLPPAPSLESLEFAIRIADRSSDLEDRMAAVQTELEGLQDQAERDLARLTLWDRSLEELESAALPSAETIDRFRQEFSEIHNEKKHVESTVEDLAQRLHQAENDLASLDRKGPVPTPDELAEARERRDLGWSLIEARLRGSKVNEQAVQEFIDSVPDAVDLASAYAASVKQVDQLADQLYAEAEAVERKTTLIQLRSDLTEQLERARGQCQELDRKLQTVAERWRAAWSAGGVTPTTPQEMLGWLRQVEQILKAADERIGLERQLAVLCDRAAELKQQLHSAIRSAGEQPPSDESLQRLTEAARRIRDEHCERAAERARLQEKLDEWRSEHAETQELLDQATAGFEAWKSEWASAVEAVRLGADTTPDEAHAVLAAVQELQQNVSKADGLRERIAGIDKDASEFQSHFSDVVARVAPDLVAADVEKAAPQLFDRLAEAKGLSRERSVLQEQLDSAAEDIKRYEEDQIEWHSQWSQLLREAQCEPDDDIYETVRRSEQRRNLEAQLSEREETLLRLAEGTALEEFIEAAESAAASDLKAQLAEYEARIAKLEHELKEVNTGIGSLQTELASMDGGSNAAELREQEQSILAAMRSDAEQYIRLKTALWALDRAIERYRQQGEGTVLARAGELFAELTLGSFARLQVDYDGRGQPVLVGVRADKTIVEVDGMSDGTRDQLYLAIRLATLEAYLQKHEPIPFIIDDILVMFDDDRAAAALRVLDELAQQTQVIFFTHHEHLIELARAAVQDNQRLQIHRLSDDQQSSETSLSSPGTPAS